MADKPLKSAYELAMDRIRAKERKSGVQKETPLTDAQKQEIARLRLEAKAKLAEVEILHRKELSQEADPEKRALLEEHYATDRRRVESRLETEIARVRRGAS